MKWNVNRCLGVLSLVLGMLAISCAEIPFEKHTLVSGGAEWWWARTHADVNGDGLLDLFVINNNVKGGWLAWNETVPGFGSSKKHLIASTGPLGKLFGCGDLDAGDIDGDGDIDVLGPVHPGEWGGATKPTTMYWYENPSWRAHKIGVFPNFIKDVDLADLNQDGKLDLAAYELWLNTFTPHTQRRSEVITLFDGQSLRGWEGNMEWFCIKEGAIVAGSMGKKIPRNEFLCTTSQYRDFEMNLQVKLLGDPKRANAGIQIRSRRIPNHHEMIGYQADMGQHYWGCLYDESRRRKVLTEVDQPALDRVLKLNDWNDYRIRCQGRRIQLWINGHQTVDYMEPEDDLIQTGVIGLQIHSGPPAEAWYRNITLRPLSPVRFKVQTINADSRFEAAGLLDINRDEQVDIFCGGFWYAGPNWTKHFVREVPEKGDYHYDFANLPCDVDGDGWTDIVNAAWHNKTLFWIKNPGMSQNPFEVIDIGKPGNMETALIYDISGDGKPDILPAVNRNPTWYESRCEACATQWIEHQLPAELKGHGIGAGDVDGDALMDIIAPKGWLEQKTGPWTWHPEFQLGVASVPILVKDVDEDGDSDIIWGMGHDYGLYWLEQEVYEQGTRTWTKHTIDTAWSQAHFVYLADMDLDGCDDLITGKRYHAHNGKDPGSSDPLCIYWYRYDPKSKGWDKHVVHEGGRVGFGINTMAQDIDNDGDIDIVAPGKSGLYLLLNQLKN